jgi:Flp pilus assembly protein TadB
MTNQYLWARITGPDPNLRAADADRERAAERLRKGHAEGRLDMNEFQERLERCYEAKTIGQLRELVRDLPRPDEQVTRQSSGWMVPWRWRLGWAAPVLIALIAIAAVSGHHHLFWLWIPLLFVSWRMSWWRRRRRWADLRHGSDDWI